jgi:hypothetical protein
MCYLCEGRSQDYEAYLSTVTQLRVRVTDEDTFLASAAEADRLRFQGSPEWSEVPIAASVRDRIFLNPDPNEGLLLFILAAWLDLQAPYTRVWTQMLDQAQNWLNGNAWHDPDCALPRGAFGPTRPHLLKTVGTLAEPIHSRKISSWFASTITDIAEHHSIRRGNLYRFVGAVCRDLYEAKDKVFPSLMHQGSLPTDYAGRHYKRLWMLVMFLRKDVHVVQCLMRRALATAERGAEAIEYWEDESYFDPKECELPVDTRVKAAWESLPFLAAGDKSIEAIGREARTLARKASVAPASFDALLFFR